MRRVPELKNDAEAEAFLDQDLSSLDFSQFKLMRFEIEPKTAALNIRLPASLLDALKAKAAAKGIPYTRYIRMLLGNDIAGPR